MRARYLFPLVLLGLGLAPAAHAGEVGVGVSGGAVWMDALEVLDDGWTVAPNASYWFNDTLGAELNLGIIGGNTAVSQGPDPFPYTAFTPRLNLIGRLYPDKRLQPLLAVGAGAFMKDVNDLTRTDGVPCDLEIGCLGLPTGQNLDVDLVFAGGPGVVLPLGKDPASSVVNLRADLRWLLNIGGENYMNHGDSFLDWETTAGLWLRFGGTKDSDRDGLADDVDKCPDQPEDVDVFEDDDGCPEADNDNDGVLDAADACPVVKEDMDGFEDSDGCLEDDNDKDGVLDSNDQCPIVAGMAEFSGCPDTDKDGLADASDTCPTEAGPIAAEGCPDKDGDLVPDSRDACPDVKANEGIDPERSDGCPAKVFVSEKRIQITETVQFDTNKATIKPVSHALLDDVVRVLQKYPGIKRLQVEGHTDSVGDDAKNLKLSQDRAASVVRYLTDHGVAADRVVAKGFGETAPIADNATKDGQATNRRVSFEILDQDVSDRAKQRMNQGSDPKLVPVAPVEGAAPAPAPGPTDVGTPAPAAEPKKEEPKKEEG